MNKNKLQNPIVVIVLLGLVSLFADMTYESARSINGPFLEVLGRSAATVGWVAGIGELVGFGIRFFAGRLTDKTHKYWIIIFSGYILNLISVPLLALAGLWQIAVGLMIMERLGKAIRSPARDAVLSFASHETGRGWGFGLHEAMDQIGATVGPLLVTWALFTRADNYHFAYSILVFPAIIALTVLAVTAFKFPHPKNLEPVAGHTPFEAKLPKTFWLYAIAIGFIAAAFADFPLIAFHLKSHHIISDTLIPALYALAMFVDALAALLLGKLYDQKGKWVIFLVLILQLAFIPLVFLGNIRAIIAGMILWGIGMGAQESIFKAHVASSAHVNKRGSVFGSFNAIFGIFWFFGSVVMGYLYDISITSLIIFSLSLQLTGIVLLLKNINSSKTNASKQTPL